MNTYFRHAHLRTLNTVYSYWLEAKFEFLKSLRLPVFSLSTLLFPVMFYLMFGLGMSGGDLGPTPRPLYLAVSFAAFGVVGACLFGFGVGIAIERGQGWTLLRRAFPAPPMAYFVAKMFMATVFSLTIIAMLLALAMTFGGSSLSAADLMRVVAVLLAGTLPFSAMGLALGCLLGPNSAPAVVNLLYLPMAFGGGLWIPVQFLPDIMQAIAPFLPTYHYAQLALAAIGAGTSDAGGHLGMLGIVTAVCLAAAFVLYSRQP